MPAGREPGRPPGDFFKVKGDMEGAETGNPKGKNRVGFQWQFPCKGRKSITHLNSGAAQKLHPCTFPVLAVYSVADYKEKRNPVITQSVMSGVECQRAYAGRKRLR